MKAELQFQRHSRKIVFLAAPDTQILDVAGPYQVFVRAVELFKEQHSTLPPPYSVLLVGTDAAPLVRTNCGLNLQSQGNFRSIKGPIDTLLVVGGSGLEKAAQSKSLLRWLCAQSVRTRRFGSVCTGAFLLAAAGLLEGKRVTTHWKWAAQLASQCRNAHIDADPIFIRDGKLYTTAGITAGMDLALALVEEDLGAPLAIRVAQEMVLYLKRPGGQSQFSTALSVQSSERRPITDLQSWILDHLASDLSVEALAKRCNMSPRNFARIFLQESGLTPHKYVERARVEAARRRLEESSSSLEKVAADCGFASAGSMRRSFIRFLRVAPTDYRARFSRGKGAA